MSNNTYGYVIVRWEIEPPKKPGEYRQINFTVLDTEGRKKEKQIGGLKYYGKKLPKDLDKEIGNAVIQAQWYQASND